jgi:rubrerythrin
MDRIELYRFALTAEVRSQKLYSALASDFQNPDTKALFNELLLLEQGHENKVREACEAEFPGYTFTLDADLSHDLSGLELSDPVAVLNFAISLEEIARDHYVAFAEETLEPSLSKLLFQFAQEEDNHKTLLLTEIQRIQGALSWFDPSELNGLMED